MRRVLACLVLVTLAIGAAPPAKQGPVYVSPVNFQKMITFKDKSEGFGMTWDINQKDFGNNKVPDRLFISFHGPQPVIVRAREFVIANNRDLSLQVLPLGDKHWIRHNYNNTAVRVVAYFDEPGERHEKKWKNYEIKVTGTYLSGQNKRVDVFQYEVMKIRGVVGCGNVDRRIENQYYIHLAKGHPKLKEIKESVEVLAKKQGIKVVKWEEYEGYDYTWKEEK
jgi:hypothetical protein